MKNLENWKEEFDKRFRPTWKRDFKENDSIEMPMEYHDWIAALDGIQAFIESLLTTQSTEMIERVKELWNNVPMEDGFTAEAGRMYYRKALVGQLT